MSRIIVVTPSVIVVIAIALHGTVFAQPYPSKPLRLIVTSAPQGGTDAIARIAAASLSESLGQQVIVDNRPGADGAIGTAFVAKSGPDGYTLLMSATASTILLPLTRANMPYDGVRELAPVSLLASTDYILSVHPSLPVKTVKDLIVLAKARPGQISFSSSGPLGLSHLAGELIKQRANVDMLHVPYKGGGAAALAILGGEVSLMIGTAPSVIPHAQTGRLRLIATAGKQRSTALPDLPTISETLPGIVITSWYGLQVPAGTPRDIIARLNTIIVKDVATERVAQRIVRSGLEPLTSSPEQFSAYIKEQLATWGKVLQDAGVAAH